MAGFSLSARNELSFMDSLYQASRELAELVAASSEPVLADHELEDIVRACRMRDVNGYSPSETAYTLTIDMKLACVNAWTRKASKSASMYDFSSDNQRFDRSQVYAHCMEQAREWQKRQLATWTASTVTAQRFEFTELGGVSE